MKAVTWHGVGDIRFGDVPDPKIEEPTDAIVRITTSAFGGRLDEIREGDTVAVLGCRPGWLEVALRADGA